MANSEKNIVITPNIGANDDPKIVFTGADATTNAQDISVYVYPASNGSLSFEGSSGQLFSITNDLTNTIFSVNDVSGIPSLEVNANGDIYIAPFGGNVVFGNTASIKANGSSGTSGQVLATDGTSLYWSSNPGYTGSQGTTGYTGSQGSQGPIGYTGSRGDDTWNITGSDIYYNAGDVGIGTTSPSTSLEIASNGSTTTPLLRFTDTDTTQATNQQTGGIEFYQSDSGGGVGVAASIRSYSEDTNGNLQLRFATGNDNEAMRIDSAGNVGIGTTPSYKLDVNGAINATYMYSLSFAQTSNTLYYTTYPQFNNSYLPNFRLAGGNYTQSWIDIAQFSTSTSGSGGSLLTFSKSNSATVDGHSAVGSNQVLGLIGFNGSDGAEFNTAAYILCSTDGTVSSASGSVPGRLEFATTPVGSGGPTVKMTLSNDGELRVGTTATGSARLYVYDTTNTYTIRSYSTTYAGYFYTIGSTSEAAVYGYAADSTATAAYGVRGYSIGRDGAYFRTGSSSFGGLLAQNHDASVNTRLGYANTWGIYTTGDGYFAGDVSIGTTSTTYRLQLSADSAAKPTSSTWTISSDARIKNNIEVADEDRCVEIIKTVPLKRFSYREDVYDNTQINDRSVLGWIAQDVETVFPKAVNTADIIMSDKETILENVKSLNADQMYATMWGALRKALAKIETLEAKVAKLSESQDLGIADVVYSNPETIVDGELTTRFEPIEVLEETPNEPEPPSNDI
jgi:hypothetical protein